MIAEGPQIPVLRMRDQNETSTVDEGREEDFFQINIARCISHGPARPSLFSHALLV